ncbi:MAG: 50S ribosomal protein L21 [Actinomycetia bacterium]|nr:50S ribosomal protein L21 [Actinomycetes bacterium]
MYAVVETGGHQYAVEPGQELVIEKIPAGEGDPVTFDRLLLVVDDAGRTRVGQPYVAGARAVGTVVRQERGPKIRVFKYKAKTNYRRRQGHRQLLTRVRIEAIEVEPTEAVEG